MTVSGAVLSRMGHGTDLLQEMKKDRQSVAFKQPATLLELLGYGYFFPTFLAGPVFNFREYRELVQGTLLKKVPLRTVVDVPPTGGW